MRKHLAAVVAGILIAGVVFTSCQCQQCEPEADVPPPLPPPPPTSQPELELDAAPELDAADAEAEAEAGKKSSTAGTSRLVQCCRVIATNAKSAPQPQQGFMMQAAASCEAAAKSGNYQAANQLLIQYKIPCN